MENLIALALMTLVLVMIPGPNVALIVANSLKHGTRYGLVTVAGTTLGVGVQLALVVLGLAAIVAATASVLFWVRWFGVAYLLYLGIRTWMEPVTDLAGIAARREPATRLFWRGFLVAVINPKLLIFNAAFIPQFVTPGEDHAMRLALTALVYLFVMGAGDALWAGFAGLLRPFMLRFNRIRNRLTGGIFIAGGIGLAIAREK